MSQQLSSEHNNQAHPAFQLIDQRHVESLNVKLLHYRHEKTGADHFHIDSDSEENVFMVALRTMPQDSTGVAHILEHTALCGSEKYPVRDPFFMMTRRSLNTFMNAMTSSDWTAYPFATENSKDYENLLSVYLDAVFFSRLDEMDFLQEGHRLEFEEMTNPNSRLQFKGVVFNEMKGAMSSPVSRLYQHMKSYLFPNNTYHYNSGGDPEHIPDLTYEQLKSFYQVHYHPSNATFFTFGNRAAQDIQARMETQVLNRFDALPEKLSVPLEKRFNRRLRVEEAYPIDTESPAKTYLTFGWLLGESTNLIEQLEAHLLSDLLLDNSASPLRKALETSDLGSNPSPMCGLDDSNREMIFLCGIEGSEAEHADAFEALVFDTLQEVAEKGFSQEDIEAMLHQLELSQREITGDGYPYGLQLIFSVTGAATHGGSVMESLDIDSALETIRQKSKAPGYVQSLVKRLLLENTHNVRLILAPDTEYSKRQQAHEAQWLMRLENSLDDHEKQHIVDTAVKLKERQEQADDGSMLPKVTLADVKPDVKTVKPSVTGSITQYSAGTNGLTYEQWYWPIPTLDDDELQLLPLYTSLLTELGAGEKDYLAMQQWQAARTGGLGLYTLMRPKITDMNAVSGYLVLSGKALTKNFKDMTQIMHETWRNARFDEDTRILDFLSLMSSRRVQGITGSGHSLAMQAASASHSLGSALTYNISGLPAVKRLYQWVDSWKQNESTLQEWIPKIEALHQKFLALESHAVIIGEEEALPTLNETCRSEGISFSAEHQPTDLTLLPHNEQKIVWGVDAQVNYCAAAYPTVSADHHDSAALTVLAGVLRNNFLHRAVREQGGAYGGGASHDNSNGVFRFYSYRDPRIEETLEDFTSSIHWARTGDFNDEHVEQSILGVVSSLDRPGSPAGEVKTAYQNQLFSRTDQFRRRYRERLLSVSKDEVIRVAEQYFDSENRSEAVVTSGDNAERLFSDGFQQYKIR